MPDLSNLLGDVYGDDASAEESSPAPDGDGPESPPAEQRVEAPAWADETTLDAAFADWTPGPAPDAPAAERKVISPMASSTVAGDAPDAPPTVSGQPLPDDLAAALSAALVDAPPVGLEPAEGSDRDAGAYEITASDPSEPSPRSFEQPTSWAEDPFAHAPVATPPGPWQRSDDDILPSRSRRSPRARRSR
jgi:hypothetical protein